MHTGSQQPAASGQRPAASSQQPAAGAPGHVGRRTHRGQADRPPFLAAAAQMRKRPASQPPCP
eukprot:3231700-Lingulodinium_polyedra.AAC.1